MDVATKTVRIDLALAQTDIGLATSGSEAYVINRFGSDFVDILDLDDDLKLLSEFSVAIDDDRSSNPQALHVNSAGEAYISLLGDDSLQVVDVTDPTQVDPLRKVDFSHFADDDGLPEIGTFIGCGDTLFVGVERLDRNNGWAPVDSTFLVPITTGTDQFFDWNSDHDGSDGIELLGLGIKSVRADPASTSGHSVLVLSSGLERVDLAAGTSSWVISDQAFSDLDIGRFQLRSFDIHADGTLYFVIASADFSEHGIHRASLDGQGADLELVVGSLQTVTGQIEVIGNEAWFPDTTIGASGLRIFDLSVDPVSEVGSALSTGLPPYGFLPLP